MITNNNNEKLAKNVNDFFLLMNNQSQTTTELDQFIEKSYSIFHSDTQSVKQGVLEISKQINQWIKQNLVSQKTKSAYRYIVSLYQVIGFQITLDIENFYSGAEDEEKGSQGKNEKEQDNNSQNVQLNSPYFNVDLILLSISHLTSITQQKKLTTELKEILLQIIRLCTIYAEEKDIQTFCRRQKLLKTFLKVYQDVIQKSEQLTDLDIDISRSVTHLLAKLTFKNRKNADYMIQKKSYELIKGILLSAQDQSLFSACCFVLANICYNNDTRLLLWVAGVLNYVKKTFNQLIQNYKNGDNNAKKNIEIALILILRLGADTKEIIDELYQDSNFMEGVQIFIDSNEQSIFQDCDLAGIYGSCVGIQRKIASFKEYREIVAQKQMKKTVNFIRCTYQKKFGNDFRVRIIYCFKESIAMLGVFAIDEQNRDQILQSEPKLSSCIVRTALDYFEDLKLVKTSIGCLTNFSVLDISREELSKEKDFYVIIYNVLESYDYSVSLLEYCLKMIMNTSRNNLCFKNYSSPKFILKLIFLSFIYMNHYTIVTLLIKIVRVLAQDDLVLMTFVKCVREYELTNREYRFALVMVESMKSVLTPCPDIIMDIILFISVILQVDKDFIQEFQEKTQFLSILKEYVDRNRHDEKVIDQVSQCIACLPLEDFKSLLNL